MDTMCPEHLMEAKPSMTQVSRCIHAIMRLIFMIITTMRHQ